MRCDGARSAICECKARRSCVGSSVSMCGLLASFGVVVQGVRLIVAACHEAALPGRLLMADCRYPRMAALRTPIARQVNAGGMDEHMARHQASGHARQHRGSGPAWWWCLACLGKAPVRGRPGGSVTVGSTQLRSEPVCHRQLLSRGHCTCCQRAWILRVIQNRVRLCCPAPTVGMAAERLQRRQ